jgi:hypothetical protein
MNSVAKVERQELATTSENAAMVSMFERMASDPNVDVDKLERLMQMRERAIERQAKEQFDAAMSQMQPDLPTIGERGNAAGRYTYALWEDINTAIKPVLMRHGFALTFRTDFANGITVTGVLSHRGGHREETSITLPADKSGSKNDVQAVASSVSYGKRYTAGALLNLTSHGEDDDAYRAVQETVNDEQLAKLNEWMEATDSDPAAFCRAFKVDSVANLPAKDYQRAVAMFQAKQKKAK